MKQQMMWNIGSEVNNQDGGGKAPVSNGLGLALLSKAMGVQTIEGQFETFLNRLKKTKYLKNFESRLKIQSKIMNEVGKINATSNAKVSKMYWKSKKKVYGINNEIHLVE